MIYPEGISDFFDENGTQETGLRSWNALGTADNSQSGCFDLGYQCAFASCAVSSLEYFNQFNWE